MPRQLVPARRLPYKKKIESILNHSTDGKCGVRFNIKWKGYSIVSKERTHFIMSFPEGKRILVEYLEALQRTSNRRFQFLMQREASLSNLMGSGSDSDEPAAAA